MTAKTPNPALRLHAIRITQAKGFGLVQISTTPMTTTDAWALAWQVCERMAIAPASVSVSVKRVQVAA